MTQQAVLEEIRTAILTTPRPGPLLASVVTVSTVNDLSAGHAGLTLTLSDGTTVSLAVNVIP